MLKEHLTKVCVLVGHRCLIITLRKLLNNFLFHSPTGRKEAERNFSSLLKYVLKFIINESNYFLVLCFHNSLLWKANFNMFRLKCKFRKKRVMLLPFHTAFSGLQHSSFHFSQTLKPQYLISYFCSYFCLSKEIPLYSVLQMDCASAEQSGLGKEALWKGCWFCHNLLSAWKELSEFNLIYSPHWTLLRSKIIIVFYQRYYI